MTRANDGWGYRKDVAAQIRKAEYEAATQPEKPKKKARRKPKQASKPKPLLGYSWRHEEWFTCNRCKCLCHNERWYLWLDHGFLCWECHDELRTEGASGWVQDPYARTA